MVFSLFLTQKWARGNFLGAHFKRGQIFDLLFSEGVDVHFHGFEFQTGDLHIHVGGQHIDLFVKVLIVFGNVFRGQGLVGKTHVHNHGGMAFGGSQIDETAIAQDVDPLTVSQGVFFAQIRGFAVCWR